MFKTIEFISSVGFIKDIPKLRYPEVILCGRSNVGKSSFINSVFSKEVAKISSHPGKTRTLNYYLVDNKFYLIDLPGYGYASVSKKEREKWSKLIDEYIAFTDKLFLAVHFIDARHEVQENDKLFHQFINQLGVPSITILTKADKAKQTAISESIRSVSKVFPELVYKENLFSYSSVKGTGKKEIVRTLNELLNY